MSLLVTLCSLLLYADDTHLYGDVLISHPDELSHPLQEKMLSVQSVPIEQYCHLVDISLYAH